MASNGDDLDGEWEDGESNWERSPFFRLLNVGKDSLSHNHDPYPLF